MSTTGSLDFVAVDMETANAQRASVCAVGIALVREGEVVATERLLVQPPTGMDSFSALNRGIHGICAEDVRGAPGWEEAAGQLEVLGAQLPLVAHNAAFDRGVYEAACAEVGRTTQPMEWLDLLELSRRLRPDSPRHTLPVLAEAYGVELEHHHDAEQDARACAEVLVAIAKDQGVQRLGDLWPQGGQVRPTTARRRTSGSIPAAAEVEEDPGRQEWFSRASKTKVADMPQAAADADPGHPLYGEHVVISGPVQGRDRYGLWERIAAAGGHPQKNVTRKTTVLVAGNRDDLAALASGDEALAVNMTTKERKAVHYGEAGQSIRAMTAVAFLEALDGQEPRTGIAVLGSRGHDVDQGEGTQDPAAAAPSVEEATLSPAPETRPAVHGAEPETSAGRTYPDSSFTPSALRRSHFDERSGPRPWEQPDRAGEDRAGQSRAEEGRASGPVGEGGPMDRRGPVPVPHPETGGSDGVRAVKKVVGAVMMLVALFGAVMTAAGIGVIVEDMSAGDAGQVGVGVGMTVVFAFLSVWLAITALRWLRS